MIIFFIFCYSVTNNYELTIFILLKIVFMGRIVLEVNEAVAKKWHIASFQLRTQLNKLIGKQLNEILDKNEPEDSIRFFNELQTEMQEKGLTQEKLNEILQNE